MNQFKKLSLFALVFIFCIGLSVELESSIKKMTDQWEAISINSSVQENASQGDYRKAVSLAGKNYDWNTPSLPFMNPDKTNSYDSKNPFCEGCVAPVVYVGYYAFQNKDAQFIQDQLIPLAQSNSQNLSILQRYHDQASLQRYHDQASLQRYHDQASQVKK